MPSPAANSLNIRISRCQPTCLDLPRFVNSTCDAEPMGKYISYPHRAATFHVPMGIYVLTSQLRNGKRLGGQKRCVPKIAFRILEKIFCLEIKMQGPVGKNVVYLKSPFGFLKIFLFRNQDSRPRMQKRCAPKIAFRILENLFCLFCLEIKIQGPVGKNVVYLKSRFGFLKICFVCFD